MNQANVKVSFYLKKSEADADGNCPVMAKLNVGKYSEAAFSVKIKVPQSRWSSGRASGKSVAAKEINNRLDEIRAMALKMCIRDSYKMDVDTYRSEPYIVADFNRYNAMNGNTIYDIYVDNEQRIWMADVYKRQAQRCRYDNTYYEPFP